MDTNIFLKNPTNTNETISKSLKNKGLHSETINCNRNELKILFCVHE